MTLVSRDKAIFRNPARNGLRTVVHCTPFSSPSRFDEYSASSLFETEEGSCKSHRLEARYPYPCVSNLANLVRGGLDEIRWDFKLENFKDTTFARLRVRTRTERYWKIIYSTWTSGMFEVKFNDPWRIRYKLRKEEKRMSFISGVNRKNCQ